MQRVVLQSPNEKSLCERNIALPGNVNVKLSSKIKFSEYDCPSVGVSTTVVVIDKLFVHALVCYCLPCLKETLAKEVVWINLSSAISTFLYPLNLMTCTIPPATSQEHSSSVIFHVQELLFNKIMVTLYVLSC